jgi:hypothetical protein
LVAETYYNGIDDDCSGSTADDDQDADEDPVVTDCADIDPARSTLVAETYYNGIDDDCSASTADDDQDVDGDPVATDCADTDPARSSLLAETYYNGVDDDCNASTPDDDQDGDGDPVATDCADTDPSRSTLIAEVYYNGLDDDCNASSADDDQDGDGVAVASDCDDTNPLVGVSCRWTGDHPSGDADARLLGEQTNDYAGDHARAAGDVDGDGFDDLLVGAYGRNGGAGATYLLHGPLLGDVSLSAAAAVFDGLDPGDYSGFASAPVGDIDGDGNEDLLVGAPYEDAGGTDAGMGYLMSGPFSGAYSVSGATARLMGEDLGDLSSWCVQGLGDVNGDLVPDFAVSAPFETGNFQTRRGTVFVFEGPVAGDLDLSAAPARVAGEGAYDYSGWSLVSTDMDADGVADLIVGAPGDDDGVTVDAGSVYTLLLPFSGSISLAVADAKITGEGGSYAAVGYCAGDCAGRDVDAGDVDGDGSGDLLIGAWREPTNGVDAGAAYLVSGPRTGSESLAAADAKVLGEKAGDYAGQDVGIAGDVDGDGWGDLLVATGSFENPAAPGFNNGVAYLLYGPVTGTVELADADARFLGVEDTAFFGSLVERAGDLDSDGFGDFVVAAYAADGSMPNSGVAYLFFGLD